MYICMLLSSNTLTILLECWGDWEIRGMCTWVFKCSYACRLSWSHASIFTCFDENQPIYLLAMMITCSHVLLLWWLHAFMFTCFVHHVASMFTCLHDLMLPCLLAYMPSCSYVSMLWWLPTPMLKCFDDHILICVDFHIFDIHTHVHKLGWWNVYKLEG